MRVVAAFSEPYPECDLLLVPNANLVTGISDFTSAFGAPTSLEEDLLLTAATIYASDVAALRGERLDFSRDFDVTIPVVNVHALERLQPMLTQLLYFLSRDNWGINFVSREGVPEGVEHWPPAAGKTLLFSGGLDSFACAVNMLDSQEQVSLVSHVTGNPAVRVSQQELRRYLKTVYGGGFPNLVFRVTAQARPGLPFPPSNHREDTQRTRSFMFLVLAALAARRSGHHKVVVIAENGQMAIHLPLSAGRIGAFSTHTAHPYFVSSMESFLSTALSFQISIENPFLYRTKSETISHLVQGHSSAIPLAVSCWRSARMYGTQKHCGECVPCLVRRIAVEYNGLSLHEYERDLFAENTALLPEGDIGKRNLNELGEFIWRFSSTKRDEDLVPHYPELVDETFHMEEVIAMYRRFAQEARAVLDRYPLVRSVLK